MKVMKKKQQIGKKPFSLKRELRKNWELYVMVLIPVLNIIFHKYIPMYGIQIAFRDYRPRLGITGSEFVGFQWFEKFLQSPDFADVFWNTVKAALYSLVINFPLPIIFALLLNCLSRNKRYKSFVQNVTYIPHFFSTVVIVSMITVLFSPVSGIYGVLYRLFGGEGYPADIKGLESSFLHIYVWSGVWTNIGWGSILYTSTLGSVSPELHEAARIDGASRMKRIIHIDLPAIAPTICIMLIQGMAGLIGADFEKALLLQTSQNLGVSEVLPTLIYKEGLGSIRGYSYGAAMGLFNTAINIGFMFLANAICKKISEGEIALF